MISVPSSTCFPINEECTSIAVASTGNVIVAGFTDGTVRLFDRTGTFSTTLQSISSPSLPVAASRHQYSIDDDQPSSMATCSDESDEEQEFCTPNDDDENQDNDGDDDVADDDADDDADEDPAGKITKKRKKKTSSTFLEVNSSYHQRYGAVACQIYAKGVHTALRLDCSISEDDQYCFASVLRGSMECVAIHIGPLQDEIIKRKNAPATNTSSAVIATSKWNNLLDYVHTYRHTDAKLRGLGACTRLKMSSTTTENPLYLLLTGKSIKNIHIWSFQPPSKSELDEPKWQCLYDCPTNGNTIQWLTFRRDDSQQQLQAISKSLHQKLRVWDISYEEPVAATTKPVDGTVLGGEQSRESSTPSPSSSRPNRPPYKDILNTECALGVVGNWIICGGELFDNQISIVSLDVATTNTSSIYNHTELALPTTSLEQAPLSTFANNNQRRQQRGDMKCVVAVSGIHNHVVLELSDGSVAEYRACTDDENYGTNKNTLNNQLPVTTTSMGVNMIQSIKKLPDSTYTRQITVRRILDATENESTCHRLLTIAVIATYHPIQNRGVITLQPLLKNRECYPSGKSADTTPSTILKQPKKSTLDESNATPTPNYSKLNANTASDREVTNKSIIDHVNVVTTLKKPKKAPDYSTLPGQPALVTTIKKKKIKRNGDNIVNKTPNHFDIVQKTKRSKLSSSMIVSTPTTLPEITPKQTSLSMGHRSSNDQILYTSDNVSHIESSIKKVSTPLALLNNQLFDKKLKEVTTPILNLVKDKSFEKNVDSKSSVNPTSLDKGTCQHAQTIDVDAATAPFVQNGTPSPPIPRKRGSLPVSVQNNDSPRMNPKEPTERKQIFPTARCNLQPSTANNKSSSNAAKGKNGARIPHVTHDLKPSPLIVTQLSSKKNDVTVSEVPASTTRDRIINLCHEKLNELQIYEDSVKVSCHSVFDHINNSKSNDHSTNPYDKQYRNMMAHHTMGHTQMRKRIIDATRSTIYSILDAPIISSLEKAKGFMHAALLAYQDLTVRRNKKSIVSKNLSVYTCRRLFLKLGPPTYRHICNLFAFLPREIKNEMIQLQRAEAYAIIALLKQQSYRYKNIHDEGDHVDHTNVDDEINFSFPTIFHDSLTFLPEMG
jgi:hypothetical protein